MRRLVAVLLFVVACGGGDAVGPTPNPRNQPIDLSTLGPHDGVLRFTLAENCQAMTVMFGVDIFLFGPEALEPNGFQDYIVGEGTHSTSGKSFPNATTSFPVQDVTVVAKQRVNRTLSC